MFSYKYDDGSGYVTTSRVVEWERTEAVGNPTMLVVTTVNSVYTFTKEAEQYA